jgi:hypothetical protein
MKTALLKTFVLMGMVLVSRVAPALNGWRVNCLQMTRDSVLATVEDEVEPRGLRL